MNPAEPSGNAGNSSQQNGHHIEGRHRPEATAPKIHVSKLAPAPMTTSAFDDRPPDLPHVTAYDERHLRTYLRLLDAADEGADWREVVQIIFGLDPEREPERARIVHDSHLARARWMSRRGYRDLLRPPSQ